VQTISDLLEQLVASLSASSTLLQDDHNLFQTCQQLRTSSVNTSCRQAARFLCVYLMTNKVERCTQVKTHKLLQVCKQVVTNLFTSCRQVVFALLVPSCQQVWNRLLTTCNKLDGIIRLVTRLFQQVWHSHDITRMLQGWRHKVETTLLHHDCISDLLEQPCNKSDNINKVVTSC
jgi:hypothetical protein